MAFTPETLNLIVQPVGGNGFRFHSYTTDDDQTAITATGYFDKAARHGLRTSDLIFVQPETDEFEPYITVVDSIGAGGAATVKAIAEVMAATAAEIATGTEIRKVITPAGLAANRATQAEAESGTAADKLTTPERVKQSIKFRTPYVRATEFLPSSDLIDVQPSINAYYALPEANGRKLVFPSRRLGVSTTTAITLPQYFDIEFEDGAYLDYTDSASSSRLRFQAFGNYGETTLGANPISTLSGSSTLTFTHTSHGKQTGDVAYVFGPTAVGGITFSGPAAITRVDANTYTLDGRMNATSTATGGGSAVKVAWAIATIAGALSKGQTTLTLGTGQGVNFAKNGVYRLNASNGLAATDTTGNFTIEDTTPVELSELIHVKSVSGDVLTLYHGIRLDYPDASDPVIFGRYNTPRGRIRNLQIIGSGTGSERPLGFHIADHIKIEGGYWHNVLAGAFLRDCRDVEICGVEYKNPIALPTEPGNGFVSIDNGCEEIRIRKNTTYGGSQVMMLSGNTSYMGVGWNIWFEDNWIRGAQTSAMSTHSQHFEWGMRNNIIEDCLGSAVDNRVQSFTAEGNIFRRITGNCFLSRIVADDQRIERNKAYDADRFFYLDETGSSVYTDRFERVPGPITIKGNEARRMRSTGISAEHPFTYSGLTPDLGDLTIENNLIECSTTGTPEGIEAGGRWKYLSIRGNKIVGGNGTSHAITVRDLTADNASMAALNGPVSGVISGNVFSDGFIDGLSLGTAVMTNCIIENNRRLGTTLPARVLTTATTLVVTDAGTKFSNVGATALVVVTLPPAASFSVGQARWFEFFVQDADGFRLQATTSDTFQISTGAAGAANGTLTCTTIGGFVRVTAIDSTKWIAEGPATGWTVA